MWIPVKDSRDTLEIGKYLNLYPDGRQSEHEELLLLRLMERLMRVDCYRSWFCQHRHASIAVERVIPTQ